MVKELPILFSAPMVRAILEGRKTVTRRVVKGGQIPTEDTTVPDGERQRWSAIGQRDPRYGFCVFGSTETECAKELAEFGRCPYGKPGERLWVRETWMDLRGTGVEHRPDPDGPLQRYAYRADNPPGSHADEARKDFGLKWKPSIHMPRVASRILLEITDVRVERLQDISDEQCAAEDVRAMRDDSGMLVGREGPGNYVTPWPTRKEAFRDIWEFINGADSWAANPWVWVVEFKRVTP
jgi:hypothetical protein